MKRRVFVAIAIPTDVKEKILSWQKKHSHFDMRWIKPENLHITVVPPWYIEEGELYHVESAIRGAVSGLAPFNVQFRKILWGPPGRPARLLWAEGETPKEFVDLKDRLELALLSDPKTEFNKKEKRPAKLHLTIARFRPGTINKAPLNGDINWSSEVGEIDLMESELKITGPEYVTLRTFNI